MINAGSLVDLLGWWKQLSTLGLHGFGYYVNAFRFYIYVPLFKLGCLCEDMILSNFTSSQLPLVSAILLQLYSFDCSILQQQLTLKQEALSIKHKNLSSSFSSLLVYWPSTIFERKVAVLLAIGVPCMDLLFISVTFVMQSHFVMVGHPRISLLTVFVVDLTVLNMPLVVQMVLWCRYLGKTLLIRTS